MEEFAPFLVAIVAIVSGSVTVFYLVRVWHQQRMAIIENGFPPKAQRGDRLPFGFRLGAVVFGIAIGLFVGYLADTVWRMDDDVAYTAFIFLFASASLLATYFYEFKNRSRENDLNV